MHWVRNGTHLRIRRAVDLHRHTTNTTLIGRQTTSRETVLVIPHLLPALIPCPLTLCKLALCLGLLTFLSRGTSIIRNTPHHGRSILAITFTLQGPPADHQYSEHGQGRQH